VDDLHPPETFPFSRCRIVFQDAEYEGWVYYPTRDKTAQLPDPLLLEVIARPIRVSKMAMRWVWVNGAEIKAFID